VLAGGAPRRFIFVGGKGGVGKTTTAASLAVRLAKSGRRTLVVSTDPAHSLGDALALTLRGEPMAVCLEGLSVGAGSLHAMEIDPTEVVEDFKKALSLDKLHGMLKDGQSGLGTGLLTALSKAGVDLESLVSLLELTPPGMDEAVALARLMQLLGDGKYGDFARVVIDTAPTGHTLRLLSFPQFLHGVIGTILSVSEQVTAFSPIPRFFGQMVGDDFQQQLRVSKASLERLMVVMASLTSVFEDRDATSFVVVTIPTHLAVTETRRMLKALKQANMSAQHLVINQCPFLGRGASGNDMQFAQAQSAVRRIVEETAACRASSKELPSGLSESEVDALAQTMDRLARQHSDARRQADTLQGEVGSDVRVYRAPVFGEELTGVLALDRYAEVLKASE